MRPSRYNLISETIILLYLAFVSLLIMFFRDKITGWKALLGAQLLAGVILILLMNLQRAFGRSRPLLIVRNWIALPYVFFSYRSLHFLINCRRNPGFLPDRDGWLIAADRFLFGSDPTIFLERFTFPWLTELMQIVYASNYLLPFILILILYLNRERLPFQKSLYLLTLGYFLSFLGYFLIPAIGPRFTLTHSFPLKGVFLQEKICHLLYFMEECPRDCFPSGHTEIPLITLWLAHRFKRVLFWIYLPIVILLVCSTVYLRFHYVVDVIAGVLLAWIVILAGKREWPQKKELPQRD